MCLECWSKKILRANTLDKNKFNIDINVISSCRYTIIEVNTDWTSKNTRFIRVWKRNTARWTGNLITWVGFFHYVAGLMVDCFCNNAMTIRYNAIHICFGSLVLFSISCKTQVHLFQIIMSWGDSLIFFLFLFSVPELFYMTIR